MWFIPDAWCAAATCLACHSHHPPGAGRCWTAPLLSMKAPMKLFGLGVHIPSVGENGTARVGGGWPVSAFVWRTSLEGEGVSGGSHRDGKPRDAGRGGGVTARGRTVVEQGRGTGRHDVLTDGSLRLDRQFRPGFLGHGAVVALPDGRPVVAPARSVTTSTSDACSSPRVSSRVCRHFFPDCLFLTEGS